MHSSCNISYVNTLCTSSLLTHFFFEWRMHERLNKQGFDLVQESKKRCVQIYSEIQPNSLSNKLESQIYKWWHISSEAGVFTLRCRQMIPWRCTRRLNNSLHNVFFHIWGIKITYEKFAWIQWSIQSKNVVESAVKQLSY